MPELPEVETTRRGILPYCEHQTIVQCTVRNPRLRWPVAADFSEQVVGQTIRTVTRRAKYLIFDLGRLSVLWHLGMSGSLRIATVQQPIRKHDHIDWVLSNDSILRFHDPRRFGSVVMTDDPDRHTLLYKLGPEPLSDSFTADYLYQQSRGKTVAVKNFIMNSGVVVGVGNIYASEALFMAGIHPLKAAGKVSLLAYRRLTDAIKTVLAASIEQGGTTLRDFVHGNGEPGYFKQQLRVYERAGQPCRQCEKPLTRRVIGQRSSYYCTQCQR